MNMPQLTPGALKGLRVVEMGQLIAGPFAAKTLGDFGADVIKIEPPGAGDPLRNWRMLQDGTSVWWQVQSRNKRSIALDLRSAEGQDIARQLIAQADVLIENFRPGTLESWGMDYETLSKTNPGLVMLRISGYGQTGPYRDLPGFGAIGEAMGGLRHLTGEPDRIPVRCGISIGDTLAALHGTIGVLMALYHRKVNGGQGQVILGNDPALGNNAGRVERVKELDAAIEAWTQSRSVTDVLAALAQASVPAGRVYTAKDIVEDPHYRARDMILQQQTRDGHEIEVPGIVPKLMGTPGRVRSSAPKLGDDTDAVLAELGMSADQIGELRNKKVVA